MEEVREEILDLEVEEVEEYKVERYQKLEEERVQFEVSRTAEAIDLKKKISEIKKNENMVSLCTKDRIMYYLDGLIFIVNVHRQLRSSSGNGCDCFCVFFVFGLTSRIKTGEKKSLLLCKHDKESYDMMLYSGSKSQKKQI